MRVRVTATNADGSNAAQSAQTARLRRPPRARRTQEHGAARRSRGRQKSGNNSAADPGSWSGNPTSFAYQWQRCDADVVVCSNIVGATANLRRPTGDLGYRLRVRVTARNAKGSATAASAITAIVAPVATITNHRPSLDDPQSPVHRVDRLRDASASATTRFKNLTITETDSRPGKLSYTRRFATLVPPRPCGVYTRHWLPVARFRGPGRYTLTLRATDKSGLTSLPARRTFSHG